MGARWRQARGFPVRPHLPQPADLLPAGCLFVAFEVADVSHAYYPLHKPTMPHVLWDLTGAVMTLSLALRRRHPLAVWLISTASATFLLAVIGSLDPFVGEAGALPAILGSPLIVLPAPLIALYTIARSDHSRGRLALAGSLLALLPTMFWTLVRLATPGNPAHAPERGVGPHTTPIYGPATQYLDVLVAGGALITAWVLGEMMRSRGDALAESAAVRRAAAEAEKAQHDRAVAAEERARIARELHDITAHHISVVTLQAGAARLLAESGRPPSAELLLGIESASRQAMVEIRHVLGVIRSSPDGAAPAPGLARLPELVAHTGLAGLAVSVQGRAGTLPGSLDLTAYRIVQEGLANVARHSQARAALVRFGRANGSLEITVADNGPARAGPTARGGGPGGHGLIGLRERVARYGGELMAGPRPGGGFLLRATLPVHDSADDRLPAAGPRQPGQDDTGPDEAGQLAAARGSAKAAPSATHARYQLPARPREKRTRKAP